jgi:hypothetical protein
MNFTDRSIRRQAVVSKLVVHGFAVALGAAICLAGIQMQTAAARVSHAAAQSAEAPDADAGPVVSQKSASPRMAGRYFVDFRARTAATYGHAFLWYGRLNDQGRVGKIEVAGLHPATDSPVPYLLGHIIPVPAETGKSYGDLDEQYLTASYRVYLNEADAKRVFAYIQHKQATSKVWHAGIVNCTGFIADIAAYMGLRTPPTATWMYPDVMVNALKEANNGRREVVLAAGR